ncbi:uncharacterized protein UTRI_03760_B [Ustilago trichophora]|uniref:Uncharacterized protein n=1 Tax=Ustilago trichophora TaxID=86804 RepID=A0A5C3DZ46_9BASI|nr:uncharacterized protein UTRI_03760_B [Ustilago trichophora]
MAPNNKASVDNSTTIRAASKNKHRAQPKSASASPFGSSASGSLASSLSSLFSPQPHGKDAALASLLASSSKPPVKLGQGSGLAAFGSFPSASQAGKSLDEKLRDRRKDASKKASASDSTASSALAATSKVDAAPKASGSTNKDNVKPSQQQKQPTKSPTHPSTSAPSKPAPSIPNIPAGRRPVFRPVLASSTAVTWPEMPVAGSKTVLHTLLETLAQPDIQEALNRDLGRRSCKASKQVKNSSSSIANGEGSQTAVARVQVLAGINSITRAIEGDIAIDLAKLHSGNDSKDFKKKGKQVVVAPPSVKVVFVCRHDLPQPCLISHLPMLVCARNAVLQSLATDDAQSVLLFPLPSGSESLLAKALNLKRASIIALTSEFPPSHMTHLLHAIQRETGELCHLRASWLETAIQASTSSSSPTPLSMPLEPTSIKLLRTSQPMDLNLCKATKKTKRKERSARWKKKKLILLQRVKSLKAELKCQRDKESKAKKHQVPAVKVESNPPVQMDTS